MNSTAEITNAYYQTTAARSHEATLRYYEENAAALLRRFRRWLPESKDANCLDLACGCGEFVFLLETLGYKNVAGVDLCEEELIHGRKFVKAPLFDADVLDFLRTSSTASLNFITALNFLEHVSKEKLLEILRECSRVLRPGGTLVAMVPNAVSPFGSLTRHWDITHEWAFTTNNFRQLATLCGFSPDVNFRECGPEPHGLVSAARFALWQLVRAGIAMRLLVELGTTKDRIYTMDMLVKLRRASN